MTASLPLQTVTLSVERWCGKPSSADLQALRFVSGPVLDIGCGPARHTLELQARGVFALGIDISTAMVALARQRGAAALRGSVFDDVPLAGRWGTGLLLDGNIGIGADPAALLARVGRVVRPGGVVLVEAAPPGAETRRRLVRLEYRGRYTTPFEWCDVGIDRVETLADRASLQLTRRWTTENRWFASLSRAGD